MALVHPVEFEDVDGDLEEVTEDEEDEEDSRVSQSHLKTKYSIETHQISFLFFRLKNVSSHFLYWLIQCLSTFWVHGTLNEQNKLRWQPINQSILFQVGIESESNQNLMEEDLNNVDDDIEDAEEHVNLSPI